MTSIVCRGCGHPSLHLLGRGARARNFAGSRLDPPLDGARIYRCGRCDLMMRHPLLPADRYLSLYASSAADHWTKTRLRPEQQRLRDYICKVMPSGGRLLDVGCSAGDLLGAFDDRFAKFGIEPSAEARLQAERAGVEVVCSAVAELAGRGQQFDVIVAVDVIEHVPDPLAFLQTLAESLSAGGRIIVSTGNHRALAWRFSGPAYYYSHFFEHVTFISARWCHHIKDQGFSVQILEPCFAHLGAERASDFATLKRQLLFFAKFLPAWFEQKVLTRLPTRARRLGPRLMLGEPGLFDDHLMVEFMPLAGPKPSAAQR